MRSTGARTTEWWRHVRRPGLAVVVAVSVLLSVLVPSTPAQAYVGTPWQCDSVPKYYCTTVEVNWTSYYLDPVNRWYEGKRQEPVKRWQLWWMQDWICNPNCTWLRNYGQQPWQTNTSWAWWVIGGNPMYQNALVNMKLRYYEEWYDMSCLCQRQYTWCTPQLDHYLWSITSASVGAGVC